MVLESDCATGCSSLWQRRALHICWFLLLLSSLAVPAFGDEPSPLHLSEYQKQDWQVENGLPENNVRMITQKPDGQLLLATGSGLSTFDGLKFEDYKLAGTTESEAVNAVFFDRAGDLWIGTDGRGVLRSHQGIIENISENAGLWNERIRMMFEDSQGALWIATQNGIERYYQGHLESFREQGMISGDVTTPFAEDRNGIFFITEKGLWFLPKGSKEPKPYLLKTPSAERAVAVYRESSGIIWVGTLNGLIQLTPGTGKNGYRESFYGKISSPVTTLLSDNHGNLWIGTRHAGVWRAAKGGLESWSQKEGLPDNAIRSLFIDKEDNLWIGMLSGGLSRWRKAAFAPYGEAQGFLDVYAASVFSDSHGDLWLGTWGKGLYRLHEGKLIKTTPEAMPIATPIRAIAEDKQGKIWIGTWFDGVYSFDGKHFQHYWLGVESPGNAVSAILPTKKGGLWIGTYTGVFYFPSGDPQKGAAKRFLDSKLITNLLEAPDGSMLVGTSTGLFRIQEDQVLSISELSHPYILSLIRDNEGYIWIGTKRGGLAFLKGNKAVSLSPSSGFPNYHVNTGIEDRDGHLWFGTSRGVVRVLAEELQRLAEGKNVQLMVRLFDRSDGMRSSECNGPSVPSSAQAKDGLLWFSTMKGFVRTTDAAERTVGSKLLPPQVRWSKEEDGSGSDLANGSSLSMEAGKDELALHFSSTNLSNPGQLEFRYRLLGYDSDWISTRARTVRYRRLPPGAYTFQAQVRNSGEPWPDDVFHFAVHQQGYFYQSWYFYAFLGLAAVLAGVQIFRWRVKSVRGQIGVIMEERNRIARECHDSLMAGFAAVSWQLEASSKMLQGEKAGDTSAAQSIHLARNMVSHCQAEARRIIWDLRDSDEITTILSEALSRTVSAKHPQDGIEINFNVEGMEIPFAPASVHHLVSIAQEAVSNAARHAHPTQIDVRLQYQDNSLNLSIRDNGCGFHLASSKTGHFGIPVMEERARKLGGTLHIRSDKGEGTEVSVNVPLKTLKKKRKQQPNLIPWIGI